MRSRLIVLTLLLCMVGMGQALADTSATVTPTKVPTGAYVNIGGRDNYYWQQLNIQINGAHPEGGTFVVHLPEDMTVADIDGDTVYEDETSLNFYDADGFANFGVLGVNSTGDEVTIAYGVDLAGGATEYVDGDEELNLFLPVTTENEPDSTVVDYYVTFGGTNSKIGTLTLGGGEGAGFTVGEYVQEDAGNSIIGFIVGINGDDLRVVWNDANDFAAGALDAYTAHPNADGTEDDTAGTIGALSANGATDQVVQITVGDGESGAPFVVGDYLIQAVTGATGRLLSVDAATGAEDYMTVLYSGTIIAAGANTVDYIANANGAHGGADDATVAAVGTAATYDDEDLLNGSGPQVTYVDPVLDQNLLSAESVEFVDLLQANDDTTSNYGETWPPTDISGGKIFALALPDLVSEDPGGNPSDGYFESPNITLALDGTDGDTTTGETNYRVWAAQDSTLHFIDPVTTGAVMMLFSNSEWNDLLKEGDNGNGGLATANLPEGDWLFYLTTDITGHHILARSGWLHIRHFPIVKIVGWDWDDNGTFDDDSAGGYDDENDVVLDSGRYKGYDTASPYTTPARNTVEVVMRVEDYDDDAEISLFYSSTSDLDSLDVVTGTREGKEGDKWIAGLTGATLIADAQSDSLYDNKLEDGYVKHTWDISQLRADDTPIPAMNYTLYAVASDGKHYHILPSLGMDTGGQETVNVRHSPKLTIDSLGEYEHPMGYEDVNSDADITINTSRHEVVMLSWGKSGTTGDVDIDDNCTITFYIDYDDAQNGTADYNSNDAQTLIDDASTADSANPPDSQGPHRINATPMYEDYESKDLSYFAWNFKEDYETTGWAPLDQYDSAGNTARYHLYAVIDENKGSNNTRRVVALGLSATDRLGYGGADTPTTIDFDLEPYMNLVNPPDKGMTISADETVRFQYEVFDWDSAADFGIFAVKKGTAIGPDAEDGPMETYLANINALSAGNAYALTDDDGYLDPAGSNPGTWATQSEDYYDMTLRLPSHKDKKVTFYVGDDSAFTPGDPITARNGATGTVINVTAAVAGVSPAALTVSYSGTDFVRYADSNYNDIDDAATFSTAETQIITTILTTDADPTAEFVAGDPITLDPNNDSPGTPTDDVLGTVAASATDGVGNHYIAVSHTVANEFYGNDAGDAFDDADPFAADEGYSISAYDNDIFEGPSYGKYRFSLADGSGLDYPLSDGDYWIYIGAEDGRWQEVTVEIADSSPLSYSYPVGTVVADANGAWGIVTDISGEDAGAGNPDDIVIAYRTNLDFAAVGISPGYAYDATNTHATTITNASVVAPAAATSFTSGGIRLVRAPGYLTVARTEETAPQRDLMLTPAHPIVAEGDTISYSVRAADKSTDVDLVDMYISVPKAYFDVVTTDGKPFTSATTLYGNTITDDTANDRWLLYATFYRTNGAPLDLADSDLGSELTTFKVVSKGTENALGATSKIEIVESMSTMSNDDIEFSSIGIKSSTVNVRPRTIVEGIVHLQGRQDMTAPVNFILRERGSYVPYDDASFYTANDGAIADSTYKMTDYSDPGVQYRVDKQGKFTLYKVPPGEWELVVQYDRYLSVKEEINVSPGLDTLFVPFGTLLGGDVSGYTDSLGYVYPNNRIEANDLNRIMDGYLYSSASDDTLWNAPNNFKFCDIDENDIVNINDIKIATANYVDATNVSGAQPVYAAKSASRPNLSNMNADVRFLDVPAQLKAGNTYTVQLIVENAREVGAYFVDVQYDTSALTFQQVAEGEFLSGNSETLAFASVREDKVGMSSSIYGAETVAGDGILAEITFTANVDTEFSEGLLNLTEASFVNGSFVTEDLVSGVTYVFDEKPAEFALGQNFPNPFNPTTTISYSLPEMSDVEIKVFDILGRHVDTLVSGMQPAGSHSVVWNATDNRGAKVSAGVYFYTIKSGSFADTKRMLLLK